MRIAECRHDARDRNTRKKWCRLYVPGEGDVGEAVEGGALNGGEANVACKVEVDGSPRQQHRDVGLSTPLILGRWRRGAIDPARLR